LRKTPRTPMTSASVAMANLHCMSFASHYLALGKHLDPPNGR
jgi:hypothetical protein